MRSRSCLFPWFLLLSLAPLRAQKPSDFQPPPGHLVSVTSNYDYVSPNSPPSIVTATVATNDGSPVSTLDGLFVDFGQLVPVKNGIATFTVVPNEGQERDEELFVAFPATQTQKPVPGGSLIEYTVGERVQPFFTALYGQYVFKVNSYAGNGTARGGEGVSIGVLNFDQGVSGTGITGEFDYNGALGSFQALPVTGSYSIDGNGICTITLQSAAGTQHFNVHFQESTLDDLGRITEATLVETDTPRLAGAGILYARGTDTIRYAPAPPPTLDGGRNIQLSGLSYFGSQYPLPVSLTVGAANRSTTTVDLVSGELVQQGIPAAVSFTGAKPDAVGRSTFSVTVQNQVAQQLSNYAEYDIDAARGLLLSTDPVADGKILLSGEAIVPPSQAIY